LLAQSVAPIAGCQPAGQHQHLLYDPSTFKNLWLFTGHIWHNLQVLSTRSIYEEISQKLATDDLGQRKMQTNIHCNFIISTTVHALQCFGCKGKKTPQ
jgi:hypothetical protein